ncbi:hypothetical protein BGX27_007633 [Mortierella sp. AM989]|nr:hypothetical protein BGX27_007633 [Mortierella sp. AM989]
MPTMPHQVALMPSELDKVFDHTIPQLDASTVVFYPIPGADCASVPSLNDNSTPLMILDNDEAKNDALAMHTISRASTPTMDVAKTESPMEGIPDSELKLIDHGTELDQSQQRQVLIPILGVASIVNSFKSEAAIRVRRVLANLGVDTGYNTLKDNVPSRMDPINKDNFQNSKLDGMFSTFFTPSSSPFHKQDTASSDEGAKGYVAATKKTPQQTKVRIETPPADSTTVTGDDMDVPLTLAFSRHHHKTKSRPSRLAQRVYPSMPSHMVNTVQNLIAAKETARHSSNLNTFKSSNNYIQYHYNRYIGNGNSTSIPAKVTLVLMSTVCTVGVGMFGVLLFVVALKVGSVQSRRPSQHGSHPHITRAQQLGIPQQCKTKKVIPKAVLERYGIQTVLHNSLTAVSLTPAKTKTKSEIALFTKGKLEYARDAIEMEEGHEDSDVREHSRRQRLQRRRRTGSGQLFRGIIMHDNCDCEGIEGDDDKDSADSGSDMDESESEGDEEDSLLEPSSGVIMEASMDMEQITAGVLSAARQGPSRRISYNRQGHLNISPVSSGSSSSTESLDTASSSSRSVSRSSGPMMSERTKVYCTSHSHKKKKKEKEKPFANASAQTMCAICLAEFEVGEKVRGLPCFHQYHQECIDPWLLNVSSQCPICKRDLWQGST